MNQKERSKIKQRKTAINTKALTSSTDFSEYLKRTLPTKIRETIDDIANTPTSTPISVSLQRNAESKMGKVGMRDSFALTKTK
jgi:hypothetical protein